MGMGNSMKNLQNKINKHAIVLVVFFVLYTNFTFSQVLSLAGNWQFRQDSVDTFQVIALPGSCEERGFGNKSTDQDANRLTRNIKYVGKAWYQKKIIVPSSWKGKRLELFLERCLWETAVWLDEKPYGIQNSLSVPHLYDFGMVNPGEHTILVSVDNTIKLPIGDWGFSITDDTQGNWNGIIGRIELRSTDPVWLKQVQVFSDHLQIKIGNITGKPQKAMLQKQRVSIPIVGTVIDLPFKSIVPNWDEFSPKLTPLAITLKADKFSDSKIVNYGIRELTTKNGQFLLNGRPTLLRGPNNECVFPTTGYPPMDKQSWIRILEICKSYGFNFMRFNSWCPPEAAFLAANEIGYFFQIEIPFWAQDFGQHPARDKFLEEELIAILENYGNHPSFALMAMGNESPGPMDVLVTKGRSMDTRMLYRCQNGDSITNGDFVERGTEIGMRGIKGPNTDWDRWTLTSGKDNSSATLKYKNSPLPTMSHEVGQWASYPDYGQLSKFTGNLRPYNYEKYRTSLDRHNMLDQNKDFARASGKFALALYKDELEGCFRTYPLGGFGIAEARDFPGEGCAVIGWLDPFWDSKGLIDPAEFRRFCGSTVCLLRMPKRIFSNNEAFTAIAEIAHYASKNVQSNSSWNIKDKLGKKIASGSFAAQEITTGKLTFLGKIKASLKEVMTAAQLTVTLSSAGTSNSWDIWVYPAIQPSTLPSNLIISYAFDSTTKEALAKGENVLFFSSPQQGLFEIKPSFMGPDEVRQFPPVTKGKSAVPGSYMPAFWSMRLFNQIGTLSILCNPAHPALADFPTEEQSNWQWADILGKFTALQSYITAGESEAFTDQLKKEWKEQDGRSKSIILNETPSDYRPIVQVIDNYERNYKLGVIFETKVGKGKLLICALNLDQDRANRPAAQQLKKSLLNYAAGNQFNPKFELPLEFLERILTF